MSKYIVSVRSYVIVGIDGKWLSRPFGSAKAALKAFDRHAEGYSTVMEVTTVDEVNDDET